MTPSDPEMDEHQPDPSAAHAETSSAAGSERRQPTSGDFLVPGPTPESNAGMLRWGLTWIMFSLILIVLMLCVSFACLTLANWTGFA